MDPNRSATERVGRFFVIMKQYQTITVIFFAVILTAVTGFAQNTLSDPYVIFQKHYDAIGGLQRLKAIKTFYCEGTTIYDGLEGRFKEWGKRSLKYRLEEDYSVITQVSGDNGKFSWLRDTNGKILIQRDEETIKRREIRKLLEDFEHLDPDSDKFSLAFESIQKINETDCYVVKMVNTINRDVTWNYFDLKTFYKVKSVTRQPDISVHSTFSDYRETDGVKHPFYEESIIFPRDKREVVRLSCFLINPEIDPSIFEPPEKDVRDFRFISPGMSEHIRFRLNENNIYLPVRIRSEERVWLLDSGASMSVIDADYAESLGLEPEGGIKGYGFGNNFELSFVTLPPFQVKGVQFDPQKVYSFKGLSANFHEPDVAGILGYDFLSRFVVKINYAIKEMSLYDPDRFYYNGPGRVMDAPLKNKTFSVVMTVDGTYSGKWSLDLGAFNTSFHFPFASEHHLLLRKGVDRISGGMADEYMERTVQFKTADLGGFVVHDPLISVPLEKGKGVGSGGELVGTIGNSLLRYFVIYLDYNRQQVIFEKGVDFDRKFPRDKSGLIIGPNENGLPRILFVAPASPAEAAGFVAGDVIDRINGVDGKNFSGIVSIYELLRKEAGARYTFEVHRNDEIVKIDLVLKDLF